MSIRQRTETNTQPGQAWGLDEQATRRLWLAHACEQDAGLWTAQDRVWIQRATRQVVSESASEPEWRARRAELVLQRVGPRAPGLGGLACARSLPRWLVPVALAAATLLGMGSEALLGGAFVNLLSLPLLGLLAWNLVVYLLLLVAWLRGTGASAGPLAGAVARALAPGPSVGQAPAWRIAFASAWGRASAPMLACRAAALVHLGAAALAVGVIAGGYLRALVLDYRAGWSSTLLDAEAVHTLLGLLYAPAMALAGLDLPDVAGVMALRVLPGVAAQAGAAPWLHLMALTLVWFVVLPRGVLAAAALLKAARLGRALPLPPGPARGAAAASGAAGHARRLLVLPHGRAPEPAVREGVRRLVEAACGPGVTLGLTEPLPYGDEDNPRLGPEAGAALVLLFDLAATPEQEVHGRLLQALGARAVLLLDQTGFVQRFGRGVRLEQRTQAWTDLAAGHGAGVVIASLEALGQGAEDGQAVSALRLALEDAA